MPANPSFPFILHYAQSLVLFILLEALLILCIAIKICINQRTNKPLGWKDWLLPSILVLFWAHLVLRAGTGDVFFDHAIGCNATTTIFVGVHCLIALPHLRTRNETVGWKGCLREACNSRMAPRSAMGTRRPAKQTKETESRAEFLKKRIVLFLLNFFALDALNTVADRFPYFLPYPSSVTLLSPLPFLHVGMIYTGLNIMYYLYAIPSVGLGHTRPNDWPPLFGDIREAYTVRRAWGRCWHQLMRGHLTSISTYIFDSLPLRTPLPWRSGVQVSMVFVLSGLLHLAGEYHALLQPLYPIPPPNWEKPPLLGGVFTTFALQPLALALEIVVIRSFVVLVGPSPRTRLLQKSIGYAWVLVWVAFSMGFYTRRVMGAGFMTGPANIPSGWVETGVRALVSRLTRVS